MAIPYDYTVSLESYLESFIPTFSNFISKSPVHMKTNLIRETGYIYITILDSEEKEIDGMSFSINPLLDKKDQIRNIKMFLENFFPTIYKVSNSLYSEEEINYLIESKGLSLAEALKLRIKKVDPLYKVIRVHHRSNEIDCMSFETKEIYKIKLHQPLELFMKALWKEPVEVSSKFPSISRIIYNIEGTHEKV